MKAKITDLCHLDDSMFLGSQLPPHVRTFIQDAYAEILVKSMNFIEEAAADGDDMIDHIHLDTVQFDWPNNVAMATITLHLHLAFEVVNNRLRVTGFSLG